MHKIPKQPAIGELGRDSRGEQDYSKVKQEELDLPRGNPFDIVCS